MFNLFFTVSQLCYSFEYKISQLKGHVHIKSILIQNEAIHLLKQDLKPKRLRSGHKFVKSNYQILVAPVTKSYYSNYQFPMLQLPKLGFGNRIRRISTQITSA